MKPIRSDACGDREVEKTMERTDGKMTECLHANIQRDAGPRKERYFCPDCHSMLFRHPDETGELKKLLAAPHACGEPYADVTVSLAGWRIAAEGSSAPVESGVRELARALGSVNGSDVTTEFGLGGKALVGDGKRILVTWGADSRVLSTLTQRGTVDIAQDRLGFDGFVLEYVDDACIFIWGNNERGAMYGCLHLAELVGKGKVTTGLSVRESPYYRIRGGAAEGEGNMLRSISTCNSYRPTESELLGLAQHRSNFILLREQLKHHADEYLTFKYMDEVTEVPDCIERHIEELQTDIRLAKKYGFLVCLQMSMWHDSYGYQQVLARHPDAEARFDPAVNEAYRQKYSYRYDHQICPSTPLLKRLIDAEIRELFERFPDVDFIHTWSSVDGRPLWCECEKCLEYPFSKRQVDYHTFLYDTIKKYNPDAGYIMDAVTLVAHGERIFEKLPRGILFSTQRLATGDERLAGLLRDPLAEKYPARYMPFMGRYGNAQIQPMLPGVNLPGLKMDFLRFPPNAPGTWELCPFAAANFAHPDKYYDLAEPFHVGWYKLAWDPHLSPDKVLEDWARDRYPECHAQVLAIYGLMDQMCSRGVAVVSWMFPARWIRFLPWDYLHPELSNEYLATGVFEDGLLQGKEAPYGYEIPYQNLYVFEEELCAKGLSLKTLNDWIDRFDFVALADEAEKAAAEVKREFPGNPHLSRMHLDMQAIRIIAPMYKNYMEAGLRRQLALGLEGDERAAQAAKSAELVKRCVRYALDYLSSPTAVSLNWKARTRRHERDLLPNLKRAWKTLCDDFPREEAFEQLVSEALREDNHPRLGIGWQPDAEEPTGKYHMLDISQHFNTPFQEKLPRRAVVEAEYWEQLGEPEEPDVSFENIPRGVQWIWDTPFMLGRQDGTAGPGDYACLDSPAARVVEAAGQFMEVVFLVSMTGYELPENAIAEVRVVYRDRDEKVIPLRRWHEVTSFDLVETTPVSRVGWMDLEGRSGSMAGFNHFKWINPHPGNEMSEIAITPTDSDASLILFAVTGKLWTDTAK